MGKDQVDLGQPPHQGLGVVGGNVNPVIAHQVLKGGSYPGIVEDRLTEADHVDRPGAWRQRGQGQTTKRRPSLRGPPTRRRPTGGTPPDIQAVRRWMAAVGSVQLLEGDL